MSASLLDPFSLRDLPLANRIVLAPMTRARSGAERIPNRLMAEYYVQRSEAGLMIAEATTISTEANGWIETPGIYAAAMVAGWQLVTSAVHQAGGRIFLQLWHTGRASHSSFHPGQPTVAASAIPIAGELVHTPSGKLPHETPVSLDLAGIQRVIGDYRMAARNARLAGFDGVEIHAANGYLIDTFLQSRTNQRSDGYGGSVANRFRFLEQVVEAVLQEWPAGRVAVRLSPNGVFNDMGSPDYREQFLYVASQLDRFGLAYLHVMDGLAFGFHQLGEPLTLEDFRKVFSGPLMGNCGYNRETAMAAIARGAADLIAFGRPFISNPDLVRRIRHDLPLAAEASPAVWYSPVGAAGYTDFPLSEADPATRTG